MITGGIHNEGSTNGGSMDGEVYTAYLVNLICASVDLAESLKLTELVLGAFEIGGVIGGIIGVAVLLLCVTLFVLAIDEYKANMDNLFAYQSGDGQAGQEIIVNAAVNAAVTAAFSGTGYLAKKQLAKYAEKQVAKKLGTELCERLLKDGADSQAVAKAIKALEKAGTSEAVIRKAARVLKGEIKTTQELVKESTCSSDELYNYLLKNVDKDAAEAFFNSGKWSDGVQIPKNSSVLNSDGSIDWKKAAKGGYKLDENGNAIKTALTDSNLVNQYLPAGQIIDRYGDAGGRYVSPVNDEVSYPYEMRSLPYIENISTYHRYEVIGDFSKLEEYIKNCSDYTLKDEVLLDIDYYYNGDFNKVVVNVGEIAKVDGWGIGGGIQYEFPIKIEYLERLGLIKEIK